MAVQETKATSRKQEAICESNQLVTFLRIKQVKAVTGMSRSWIYEAIHRRVFPAPVPLGARAVGWDSRAVAGWQADCIEGAAKRRGVRG